MKVIMFTNTFTPHIGGVARSVQGLADELRRQGHQCLVVAPLFEDVATEEEGVLRIPAVQHFNGTDFSLPMPSPARVHRCIEAFQPDIVHSHHPFLLGETALRVAAACNVPVVFTHHTRYEQYTHYLPGDSRPLKHFVFDLVHGYCNLCTAVVAPSESIGALLRDQQVRTPIEVIPSGIDPLYYVGPEPGPQRRHRLGLAEDVFVLGHVGRLAPEKNLTFLVDAVARYLERERGARFLLVGDGPQREHLLNTLLAKGLQNRIALQGVLTRSRLAEAYGCMDVFVFASRTETQGLVLAEAMAAGTPVVALDAPGVRDIVVDGANGRLLLADETNSFVQALGELAQLSPAHRANLRRNAYQTALTLSLERCTKRMVDLYRRLAGGESMQKAISASRWQQAQKRITREFEILANYGHALEETIGWTPLTKPSAQQRR